MLAVPMSPPGKLKLVPLISPVSILADTTLPAVIKLPPMTLPNADIESNADMLLLVTLPLPPSALLTIKLLREPRFCKLELITLALSVGPEISAASALTMIPVSCRPLPTKKLAFMLPTTDTAPLTATSPPVFKLPPVTLPVARTIPAASRLLPRILPVAEICPLDLRLPATTLPPTLKLVNVPTVCKLELITLALRVLPTISLAGALEITPVSSAPLPTNSPLDTTLPDALMMFAAIVPSTVAPVPDTIITLATLALLMLIVELLRICILLVPLVIPVNPPIL